jgi:hypothetical protein
MKQRGRKSAAALSVVGPVDGQLRPDPLPELTSEQAVIWRETVDAMRPGWFTQETWPTLGQYCRHIAYAHRIAKMIETANLRAPGDRDQLFRLIATRRSD